MGLGTPQSKRTARPWSPAAGFVAHGDQELAFPRFDFGPGTLGLPPGETCPDSTDASDRALSVA